MKRVKLPPNIQKELIEGYKKRNDLTWKKMAEKFKLGKSTLGYFYREGERTIPKELFEEIIKHLSKSKKKEIIQMSEIMEKNIINDKKTITEYSRKKAVQKMRERYGKDYFHKIGKKGGEESKKMWNLKRRIKQSFIGKRGGKKNIKNMRYVNIQEKELSIENRELGLNFKTNHFISPDINFDFVYVNEKNKEIIAVEEVMNNPLRQIASLIEKKGSLMKIYKNVPFIASFNVCKNYDLIFLLIKYDIFPIFYSKRGKLIPKILYGTNKDRKDVIYSIKKGIFSKIKKKAHQSYIAALHESNKKFDKYEELVHEVLSQMNLNPKGKKIVKTVNEFAFTPDNRFSFKGGPINVVISCSNSRGSLYYSFYNHSSYGVIFKNICKKRQKTMSVIFDFSGTASGYSDNIPRKLWLKYCDYNILINEYNTNKLKDLITNSLMGSSG